MKEQRQTTEIADANLVVYASWYCRKEEIIEVETSEERRRLCKTEKGTKVMVR